METEAPAGWKAGLLAGFGHTHASVDALNSDTDADSFTIGAYGARAFGQFRLQVGATYTYHAVDTERRVVFPGFTETLDANYDASQPTRPSRKSAYAFDTRSVLIEPFAGLAVVHQENGGFTETGGTATLTVGDGSQTLGVTTLGVRAAKEVAFDSGSIVTFSGTLGWRHTFGDVTPEVTSRFADGGSAFTVSGTPIDTDTALAKAGTGFRLDDAANLALTYRGEFGEDAIDQSLNSRLTTRF
ncbi:autotransporter outer membrane beta-barrel domain-containing protein [Breoghania sp.]|uniref:autotransporter outer membrane beta-barrel domain-containing protein n=1 Tax=Breoghania sp. TaxID=2065378 RepID=UPI00262C460E|nr:autotransporter outer membrane beta-barrel domain-containing protein [Breoghania sp.]MDJ0933416.1 autotransporter outer membrane beta-barrel domain-containing protein [Breoghania sp.]